MHIDGLTLSVIIKEIKERIVSNYVKKIQMPSNGRFYFELSHAILYITILSSDCYVALTEKKEPSLQHPDSFTMLLRKYLAGSRIQECQQLGNDRIFEIDFRKRDEIGDSRIFKLFFEIMGRNSNIILTDEKQMIIEAWKRRITDKRSIVPGVEYEPYLSNGMTLDEYTEKGLEFLIDAIQNNSKKGLPRFVQSHFQGFGRQHVDEIGYRLEGVSCVPEKDRDNPGASPSTFNRKQPIGTLDDAGILSLHEILTDIQEQLNDKEQSLYIFKNDEGKATVSPVPLLHLLDNGYNAEKKTPSKALESANGQARKKNSLNEKIALLKEKVIKKKKNIESNTYNLEKDLAESDKAEELQKEAELIMGNIHLFDPHGHYNEIKVTDWETGGEKTLSLDQSKELTRNAQKMFQKAAKLKRRKKVISKRLKKLNRLIYYYELILNSLEDVDTEEELNEIKEEMKEAGLLKSGVKKEKKKKKKAKRSSPREFEYNGFKILVGRNNRQNDKMTREHSREDYWFHARNIPGSHVIVQSAGREVPEPVKVKAAELAARFSKARGGSKVPVDYTRLKYVKKSKGAPPGFVIYDYFNTLIVDPAKIRN